MTSRRHPPWSTSAEATPVTLGLAALMRHAYAGHDLAPIAAHLASRLAACPHDAAAAMDLCHVMQLRGDRAGGLDMQARALDHARVFRVGGVEGLRVLALVARGDLMANTPLEFLLEGSDVDLTVAYVAEDGGLPSHLPDHDVAFLAIGESPATLPTLEGLAPRLTAWPRPIVNGRPECIAALTRDGVSERLEGSASIVAPPTRRLTRDDFGRMLSSNDTLWPAVVRPRGTHAGEGLEKIDDASVAATYLNDSSADTFYLAPFVDYRSSDGRYRKYRIVFVAGAPFICHLAVSDYWMVHYLSAGMTLDAWRREEEAAAMAGFDETFCVRHAEAFEDLTRAVGLDYFGIDCAETPEGRLLVFEVDVAMIVHALDDPDVFAYKLSVMRRTFDAFVALLYSAAAAGVDRGELISSAPRAA